MGFKLGVMMGMAAGYVLGTKAGQERYTQIMETVDTVRGSATARALEDGLREAIGVASEELPDVLDGLGGLLDDTRS